MVDRANGQTELNFDDIEKSLDKNNEQIELSSFNKNLVKAIKFNPKKEKKEDNQTNLEL